MLIGTLKRNKKIWFMTNMTSNLLQNFKNEQPFVCFMSSNLLFQNISYRLNRMYETNVPANFYSLPHLQAQIISRE